MLNSARFIPTERTVKPCMDTVINPNTCSTRHLVFDLIRLLSFCSLVSAFPRKPFSQTMFSNMLWKFPSDIKKHKGTVLFVLTICVRSRTGFLSSGRFDGLTGPHSSTPGCISRGTLRRSQQRLSAPLRQRACIIDCRLSYR